MSRPLLNVAVLIIIRTMADGQELSNIKDSGGVQRYCGRNLVNALTTMCDGYYNQMLPGPEEVETLPQAASIAEDQNHFLPKRSVSTIFVKRNRRGAYDECCRKGCTLDEMLGYCGSLPQK